MIANLRTEDGSLSVNFDLPFPYQEGYEIKKDIGETYGGTSYEYVVASKKIFLLTFDSISKSKADMLEKIFKRGGRLVFTPDVSKPESYNVLWDEDRFLKKPRSFQYDGWWECKIRLKEV
jgi:hypothetical protein